VGGRHLFGAADRILGDVRLLVRTKTCMSNAIGGGRVSCGRASFAGSEQNLAK
jgi:hypothetical protein